AGVLGIGPGRRVVLAHEHQEETAGSQHSAGRKTQSLVGARQARVLVGIRQAVLSEVELTAAPVVELQPLAARSADLVDGEVVCRRRRVFIVRRAGAAAKERTAPGHVHCATDEGSPAPGHQGGSWNRWIDSSSVLHGLSPSLVSETSA